MKRVFVAGFSLCLLVSATSYVEGAVRVVGQNLVIDGAGVIKFPNGSQQSAAAMQGPAGPVGPVGPAGPPGPAGPSGPSGSGSSAGATPWQAVSTSATAAVNTSYLPINDSSRVSITLPASPSVGDFVKVSGAGSAGWEVTVPGGLKLLGSSMSQAWSPKINLANRSVFASSVGPVKITSDGAVLTSHVPYTKLLYRSTDDGVNWTSKSPPTPLTDICVSSDGNFIVGSASYQTNYSYTKLYTSSDAGETWADRGVIGGGSPRAVSCTGDGSKVAVATQTGTYFSQDLSTWLHSDSTEFSQLAITSDGSRLYGLNTQVQVSADSGATWTKLGPFSFAQWNSMSISADGRVVAVVGVVSDYIYVSTDYGVTWAQRGLILVWTSLAMSADGNKIVASAGNGQIFTSDDAGTSWSLRVNGGLGGINSLASSADGSKLAGSSYNQIYTSSANVESPSSISGGAGDSVELVCTSTSPVTYRAVSTSGNVSFR